MPSELDEHGWYPVSELWKIQRQCSAGDNNPDDSEDDQESDASGTYTDIVDTEGVKSLQIEKETEELKVDIGEASDPPVLESCDHDADPEEKSSPTDMDVSKNARGLGNCNNEEINMLEAYEELSKTRPIDHGIQIQGSESSHKKSLKMAFCPKEVKKMLGSKELSMENAQSHTMRKILVFAPLGIRHGSEDMYELDFNHFSIFHKGEPYINSKKPGVCYYNYMSHFRSSDVYFVTLNYTWRRLVSFNKRSLHK